MKKTLISLFAIALLMVGSATFASAATNNLRMASGLVGGMDYAVASGLAAVYQKHSGETHEVLTKKLDATYPELYAGRYELALQTNILAFMLYNNIDLRTLQPTGSKEQSPIRTVMMGNKMPAGFVAIKSSGMTSVADLKGKRATLKFSQFAPQFMANLHLLAAGLEAGKDVVVVQTASPVTGAQQLTDGTVDASFGGTTMPAFREADAAKTVRFLSHSPTPEIEARVREVFPGAVFVRVNPDPAQVGVPEPVWLIAQHNVVLSAINIPEDVIYKYVKTIYENRQELVPYAPDFKEWVAEPPANLYAAAPFHPGAIRFYKEAGLWSEEMEKWNQKLLDVYKK